jgi:CheY-like chemotaxis protein
VRAVKKEVEVNCKIDADVPVFVEGDATRLRQVLMNLMGNAVKFVEKGWVTLNVKRQKTEGDCVELLFSVRDTGIGIPADKLNSVFEKFTQADSSTTRKYGGTGLGLPISKMLIELMGGNIWLESEPGVGTVFFFVVKFCAQKGMATVYLPRADIKEVKGLRFLVVDDNLVNRIIIREMAQSWGASCEGAAGGDIGLAKVAEEQRKGAPFHAIFVDFNMPGMDGYEFCRRLMADASINPKPALALVTSDTVRFRKEDFRAIGVNTHIMKPVKKQVVLDAALEMLAAGRPAPAAVPKKTEGYTREDLPALSVLIADDSDDNRVLMSSLLKGSKVRLELAENGLVALEKFRSGAYDVVFMDIQMPELDGFETTRKLRELEAAEKRARTRVVALTAMAMREDIDKALKSGCDDYLTKPIRKNTFYGYLVDFKAGKGG